MDKLSVEFIWFWDKDALFMTFIAAGRCNVKCFFFKRLQICIQLLLEINLRR